MEYNTTRERLILPNYGRNIQNMVNHAMTLTDRNQRQQCAETIIKLMAEKMPQQKDTEEQLRMLWDHLALISGYKLDVDSPYPINIKTDQQQAKPHLDYPDQHPTLRHYGVNIEKTATALAEMPEGEEKQQATELLVAQMAKSLAVWNKNILAPQKLADDINQLTNGKVTLDITPQRINSLISAATAQAKPTGQKKKKK